MDKNSKGNTTNQRTLFLKIVLGILKVSSIFLLTKGKLVLTISIEIKKVYLKKT